MRNMDNRDRDGRHIHEPVSRLQGQDSLSHRCLIDWTLYISHPKCRARFRATKPCNRYYCLPGDREPRGLKAVQSDKLTLRPCAMPRFLGSPRKDRLAVVLGALLLQSIRATCPLVPRPHRRFRLTAIKRYDLTSLLSCMQYPAHCQHRNRGSKGWILAGDKGTPVARKSSESFWQLQLPSSSVMTRHRSFRGSVASGM